MSDLLPGLGRSVICYQVWESESYATRSGKVSDMLSNLERSEISSQVWEGE